MNYYNIYIAQAFNSGAYGGGNYQTDDVTVTPGGGTTTSTDAGGVTDNGSSSLLTNTGFDIAVTVTLASLILIAAIVVRVWKRTPKSN